MNHTLGPTSMIYECLRVSGLPSGWSLNTGLTVHHVVELCFVSDIFYCTVKASAPFLANNRIKIIQNDICFHLLFCADNKTNKE